MPHELKTHVIDELNVREVVSDDGTGAPMVVETTIKPNFRALGKRFGNQTQAIAARHRSSRPRDARGRGRRRPIGVHRGRRNRHRTVRRRLGRDRNPDRRVGRRQRRRAVGCPRPRADRRPARAGLAREVIRFVQDKRKTSGLDISDRIELWWQTADDAVGERAARARQPRSPPRCSRSTLVEGRPDADITPHHEADLGLTVWLRVAGG